MPLALGCWFWGQIGTYLYLYSIKLIRFYLIYHNPTCCWCIRSTGWCCRCQCRWCCQWFFKQTISRQLLLYVIKQVQNAANGCSSWISGLFTHFFSWHFGSSSTFDHFWSFDMFDTLWRIQSFQFKTMQLLRLLTLLIQPIETFEAICNNIRLKLKQTQKVEVKISNWSNQKSFRRNLWKI